MKTTLFASALLVSGFLVWKYSTVKHLPEKEYKTAAPPTVIASPSAADNTRIQVAILLDTSNSMDGLIDQAKSRLWNIINTLTTLKYKGKTPVIEIALYEYGNDGLSPESGYIRQVAPLTTDLDLISEKLFSLRTNGGSEYCGAVINSAVKSLEWGHDEADMKLIYIAGNEPFDQGRVNYSTAAGQALSKSIFINTIYCGDKQEGIATHWKDGADKGQGQYFNIDSDRKVDFIETPYDKRIEAYNERINKTYIAYGAHGESKKNNQVIQDKNARDISSANSVERYVSKSKSVYKNDSWDLVDRAKQDPAVLKSISKSELPKELREKSAAELQTLVAAKSKERDSIQKEIAVLGKQRQKYIDEAMKKSNKTDDLGAAINRSIIQVAATKGYTAEK
ncbi:vWA domain-containing protein [Chitinophaga sp.]|uniref:vWA domain-containing protein n=1 Tax=Chitinophaga sp. TaxID=1869181 RepID=UPI002CEF5F89|nr:vWA domain-containing protein [Chitinophaga sp.]HWV68127.1 vWA domain-containing protein [Chitinophaga sp.]